MTTTTENQTNTESPEISYFGLALTVGEAKRFLALGRFWADKSDKKYILEQIREVEKANTEK